MFMFDRCHCSLAAETPDKYECDSEDLTYTFTKAEISLIETLTNKASVTPTPGKFHEH